MRSGDRIRPVEAVTFDVGLTLLFRPDRVLRRRLRAELSAWLDAHGLRVESDRFRRLSSEAEVTYARLSADGREPEASKAAADFVTSLELDLTVDDRAQLQRMVEGLFRDYPTRPTSGAVDALRRLRERGVRLGIVSNRGRRPGWIAQQYLEICGLASFFEPGAIAWSDEVGWRKPDPRIFLLALRALETPPERAAHVGDSLSRDIVPARDLGMMAIRYVGAREEAGGAPPAHAVISDYRELPATLGLDRQPAP